MQADSRSGESSDRASGVRERVRAQSKLLFGSSDRLEVAVAIALSPDGQVNATDLSWELHIANNRVRAQLLALTTLGFLNQHPVETGKKWYERVDSPFWELCRELHETWST